MGRELRQNGVQIFLPLMVSVTLGGVLNSLRIGLTGNGACLVGSLRSVGQPMSTDIKYSAGHTVSTGKVGATMIIIIIIIVDIISIMIMKSFCGCQVR